MAIGLSLDLAVILIACAVLYSVAKEGDWLKMLAKYMFLILALAVVVQLVLDYSGYSLIFTGLIIFFVGIFIFELVTDLYKIIVLVIKPLLHKRFR